MNMRPMVSGRRVRAIFRKEVREYRRSGGIVYAMVVLPLIFLVQPVIVVFTLPANAGSLLSNGHLLLHMLGIPALVPAALAAYSVVGERQQGTLEPVLSTPVRREELLLGKALAAFVPSVVLAYAIYAVFLGIVRLFAHPSVATGLIRLTDIVAQVLFTPLLAAWSIWLGMAISTRCSEIRVAQQLGLLAGLPAAVVASLTAFNVIHASLGFAVGAAAVLLVLVMLGWRVASALFDRERLITGTR